MMKRRMPLIHAVSGVLLLILVVVQGCHGFTSPTAFTVKTTLSSALSSSSSRNNLKLPSSFSSRSLSMSMIDPTSTNLIDTLHNHHEHLVNTLSSLTLSDAIADSANNDAGGDGGVSYSKASYYTTLGLYLMSFPGVWSTVQRSTKAKVKRKTFVSPGEKAQNGKDLRQQAGEIMAYFKANNYEAVDAGETITFRGIVQRSRGQAFFLTFCTALGLASLALVLQIQFKDLVLPGIGSPNWFYLVLLSPYAGIYYWKSGDRVDDFKVKLTSSDDDTQNEIAVEGSDEEIERMWRTLDLREKGMVKVEGLLENAA